ncbi:MAG: RNA chaperone Hfq [Terriglobales bacterium]
MDSTAVGRAPEPEREGFANRKLIRPTLNHRAELRSEAPPERRERPAGAPAKKAPPPEQTHAENFYYQKQMQSKTAMVVVLQDGEELHGVIEWYDRNCIKLTRSGQANVLVYKPAIKYMYKESEAR